ncbi:squalene synthase HpnC [Planctomycetales bacterium ZRK34]|nr:squalene synthase HpnC [Planctomycetales bacterium ZRK34]
MASTLLCELDRLGPDAAAAGTSPTYSASSAAEYTRRLVNTQYENFSVVSFVAPKRLRQDFANVYAFCRWADDLGDETGDRQQSLDLLAWWQDELEACYAGRTRHPVYVALSKTIEKHDIPMKPFADLIDAFVQDQRVVRYETWEQVLDYCTRSADPVGRLVLYLCGYRDAERQTLSDATCTALQLVNFWQDVRRDIVERDRIYVPAEDLHAERLTHEMLVGHVNGTQPMKLWQHSAYRRVIRTLVDRTAPLFERGRALWPLLADDVRLSIQLFTLGGESIAQAIRQLDYNTLEHRPSLSKAAKLMLMGRVLAAKYVGAPV